MGSLYGHEPRPVVHPDVQLACMQPWPRITRMVALRGTVSLDAMMSGLGA